MLEARSIALSTEHRALELTASAHELQHDLKLQHELLHDSEQSISQAEKFLNLTLSEYNRGVKNGPDVLAASQKLLAFRARDIELKRDYQIIHAGLSVILEK